MITYCGANLEIVANSIILLLSFPSIVGNSSVENISHDTFLQVKIQNQVLIVHVSVISASVSYEPKQ